MNRRSFMAALPALLLQPEYWYKEPPKPKTADELLQELTTALYVYSFRVNNHEARLLALERCAGNCDATESAAGPV